jgi:hypothetical protein
VATALVSAGRKAAVRPLEAGVAGAHASEKVAVALAEAVAGALGVVAVEAVVWPPAVADACPFVTGSVATAGLLVLVLGALRNDHHLGVLDAGGAGRRVNGQNDR